MSESLVGVLVLPPVDGVFDEFTDMPWLADAAPLFDADLDMLMPVPGCAAPASLTDEGRIDAVLSLTALKARIDAQLLRLLATISPAPTSPLDKEYVREQVALALRESSTSARWRIEIARELCGRLSDTLALIETGDIPARYGEILAEACWSLDDDAVVAQVQERVLRRAGDQTPAAFRASVRRAVTAADTRAAEQRHQAAVAERSVRALEIGDGMGQLVAVLPLPDIAQIMARIDAVARTLPKDATDSRSMDQRRADAVTDLLLGQPCQCATARADSGGQGGGQRPGADCTCGDRSLAPGAAITVTMGAGTLLGLDDQPAELDGWGTIPASLARALATDPKATLRRLLFDPVTGRMLDYGRDTYTPPKELADHVRARDHTCRFPRCRRRAVTCDIDHLHAWADGGDTAESNCECLCARHHHLKHDAGWTIHGTPDSTLTWVTPTGHTHKTTPANYRDP